MKAIIFEKYKILNACLLLSTLSALLYMSMKYTSWFGNNNDIYYLYNYRDGIYEPIFYGGKWLAGILAALLLFPARIFRKWLFFIAPPIILLTYFLVQGISVYSGNLLNPTRAQMAENGMSVLTVITALFVAAHLVYDWKKKKQKI